MKPTGKVWLHRRIITTWQWTVPVWRGAWAWCLMEAAWKNRPQCGLLRGQFWFSISWADELWDMTESQARYFLKKAELAGDIKWERGGRKTFLKYDPTGAGGSNGGSGREVGRITILKYDDYQTLEQGIVDDGVDDGVHDGHGILQERIRTLEEERTELGVNAAALTPPPPPKVPKPRVKRSPKAEPMTKEQVKEAIESVNLSIFRDKYTEVDVYSEHDGFFAHYMGGVDLKTGRPLYEKHHDWNLAFHTWCRNAKKWGTKKEPEKYTGWEED